MRLQSVIRAIYPPQCVACGALTAEDHGLCGSCWSETVFLGGLVCDTCGTSLQGEDDGTPAQCDDCMTVARPWRKGRSVLAYSGVGRRLVLGLKHGDRTDLVPSLGRWMAAKLPALDIAKPLIVPVPLHWARLARRRYNQSALLAQTIAHVQKADLCVDALLRPKRTKPLDGHNRDQRFAALASAVVANPRRAGVIAGRNIVLVDDVMTSGATLAACTEAANAAGAAKVSVVTLARVIKDT